MTAKLSLLAAGRAAVADGLNRGTNAVRLTRVAIGDGLNAGGADDDARAALRSQRDGAAAAGSTAVPARIAYRADIAPSGTYQVTEIGLFAKIGEAGAEFLFAYWAAADAAGAAAGAVPDSALTIAGVVAVVDSDAEVRIAPSPTINLSDPWIVNKVSANRAADNANIAAGTVTTLATLALTPGYWDVEVEFSAPILSDYANSSVNIWVSIDGIVVARSNIRYSSSFGNAGTLLEGVFRRRVAAAANHNVVVKASVSDQPHRYTAIAATAYFAGGIA